MQEGYVLLTEKEEIWAKMLAEVLGDNNIPCTLLPVNGAGFSIKTGIQDRLKIYVPSEKLSLATDLVQELFGEEILGEDT